MSKSRQNSWTEKEDALLAETVIRHIKEGSTQIKAFEELGPTLSRTSAACAYRWNSVVRKQYVEDVEKAKKERKVGNADEEKEVTQTHIPKEKLNLSVVIDYLQLLEKVDTEEFQSLLEKEKQEKEKANEELRNLQKEFEQLQSEYQSLQKSMDQVRKAVVV